MSAHKAAASLAVWFVAAGGTGGWSQVAPETILEIDIQNRVSYISDVTDYSRLATDQNRTTPVRARNFETFLNIADVVAVNEKPAKGTQVTRTTVINLASNPRPGQGVADIVRTTIGEIVWEILQADGTPIGSIVADGLHGGPRPPGALVATLGSNLAIIGGTGAFLGVRGQAVLSSIASDGRDASTLEDPANRRANGGGARRFILHLIPMSRPEVVSTPNGSAVVHSSDFTLVTAAKPARSGEVLSMIAANLGPTRPGVNPGQPFPVSPLHVVNSPVEVTVNGQPAEVLYAGGYPGTTNTYQVNFRLPSGVAPGQATLQLAAAWIAGPEVRVAVQ